MAGGTKFDSTLSGLIADATAGRLLSNPHLGTILLVAGSVERPAGGGDRHHHADPAVACLCAAGRPAARGRHLRLNRADHALCGVRHQPGAGCRPGCGGLADDGRNDRSGRPAGKRRLRGCSADARLPVRFAAARHGPVATRISGEFSQPSGDRRFHHRERHSHRCEPAAAHSRHCRRWRHVAGNPAIPVRERDTSIRSRS